MWPALLIVVLVVGVAVLAALLTKKSAQNKNAVDLERAHEKTAQVEATNEARSMGDEEAARGLAEFAARRAARRRNKS